MKLGPRISAILGIGVAVALVAGGGMYLAQTSAAASLRYVTAVAGTGEVTQTYTATGAVARKKTATAAFAVGGTVKSVAVAVGDSVQAGDTLAVLNKTDLQLAVLNASAAVAQAEASLYSAQHPSSASTSGGAAAGGVFVDPALLTAVTARVNAAVLDQAAKCDPLIATLAGPSGTGPTDVAGATDVAEPTTSASPTTTASASPTATTDEVSDAELAACTDARAELTAANVGLQGLIAKLTAHGGSSGKKAATTKVSASAVAKAKAALLSAQQNLDTAEANLARASLVAPISGTVGTVSLSVGASASSGSITIIGSGNAELTFELPLRTRELVAVGQAVSVSPAGSQAKLSGKITSIATLATSGTSGDTASYTTTAVIEDAQGLLPSGSKAGVTIPVKAVVGVLRVPASALTPTGTGTGTVQVVSSASATTASSTPVTTGAVGGGWVQITSGLDSGAIVVLADNTAQIPANQTTRRRTTSTSTTASSAQPSSNSSSTSTTAPSAQPTGTATKR